MRTNVISVELPSTSTTTPDESIHIGVLPETLANLNLTEDQINALRSIQMLPTDFTRRRDFPIKIWNQLRNLFADDEMRSIPTAARKIINDNESNKLKMHDMNNIFDIVQNAMNLGMGNKWLMRDVFGNTTKYRSGFFAPINRELTYPWHVQTPKEQLVSAGKAVVNSPKNAVKWTIKNPKKTVAGGGLLYTGSEYAKNPYGFISDEYNNSDLDRQEELNLQYFGDPFQEPSDFDRLNPFLKPIKKNKKSKKKI